MLGKQRGEEGMEGAIVKLTEGVADCQLQMPFSSLKESVLMVQRRALILLFFFWITVQRVGVAAPPQQ